MAARLSAVVVLTGIAGCGGGGGGGGGNASSAAPPIINFAASPSVVDYGGSTTLTWRVTYATRCMTVGSISGWTGDRPLSGSQTISGLTRDTTFRLSCSNAGFVSGADITVRVQPPLPPTLQVSASPSLVQRGQTVTVTWTSSGADFCSSGLAPVTSVPTSGSQTFEIDGGSSAKRDFSVSCTNSGGTVEKTVTVDVQTLAGTLLVPPGINADTDINDPRATYQSNDSFGDAGNATDFGVVPGYVNQPRSGPTGRSYESGDPRDLYRTLPMTTGQVIRLIMPTVDVNQPESLRDDADLYLYDFDGRLVDAAVGSGPIETLVVSQERSYVIEVRSVRGGLNYLLSLEDPATPATATPARLRAEFVIGEALVVLEPAAGETRGKVGAGTNSGRVSGTPDSVTRLVFPAAAMGRSKTWILEAMPKPVPAGALSDDQVAKLATLLELKELRRRGDVRYAALNRIVHAYDVVPADPEFPRQWWHYSLASLPLAWQVTIGSPDVVVAVADTGIVLSHPDLRAKLVDGYDLVSDPDGWDGDGIDSDPSDAGYCCSGGWVFHGTHVAGTIGASTNNGVGVAGAAWGARLMPVRVLDGRSGTIYDVLQGVRYAAGLANDSGHVPQRRAAIVNVSLGINGECSDLEADLFRQVAQAGVIVVAAAGNAGDRRALSPASCPDVFSVGAAGPNGTRAGYSNYGPHVDLLAPGGTQGAGEGVFSTHATRAATTIEPTYGWLMGTSMAAAHFSGVLALMKSLRPSLTPLEVWQALEAGRLTDPSSGRPATEVGRDDDGYGLLNAAKAVATAGDGTPSEPRLSVAPTSLRFDNFTSTASFLLSNAGSGSLVVDSVRSTVSWATVTRSESNVTGIGRYDVLVTRGDFHRGTRTGTIVVENSAGTQEILLTGTYVEFSSQSRPGNVQVRVVDASTGATVRTQYQASQPFVESFRFDDVPPGKYVIIAGTDMNNDGNLCDPGELCGSYPLGALPDYIDYTGVSVGLEIPIAVTAVAAASAGKDSSGPRAFLAGTPARD